MENGRNFSRRHGGLQRLVKSCSDGVGIKSVVAQFNLSRDRRWGIDNRDGGFSFFVSGKNALVAMVGRCDGAYLRRAVVVITGWHEKEKGASIYFVGAIERRRASIADERQR